MSICRSAGILGGTFLVLMFLRMVVFRKSRLILLRILPKEIGLSVFWLYRLNLIEIFLLTISITLRCACLTAGWPKMASILAAGLSFWCFVYTKSISYSRSVLFASSVSLLMSFWMIGYLITVIVSIGVVPIHVGWDILFWLVFDFLIVFSFARKSVSILGS